jgi:threonine/homoserine/homoserine lactone efflux protein
MNMKALAKLFILSFGTSAWGSIPLGVLNIAAIQIAAIFGYAQALQFAVGVVLVEVFYVRLTLIGYEYLSKQKQYFKYLNIAVGLLICGYAIYYLYQFFHPTASNYQSNISKNIPFFLLGMLLNAINFLQITYWMGWNFFFFNKNILQKSTSNFTAYLLGIGLGTFTMFAVFIGFGSYLQNWLKANQSLVFLLTAALLFFISASLLFKKENWIHLKLN